MPTTGSITKTVRINSEDKEYLERIMAEEGLTWSGAVHKIVSERGVPEKEKKDSRGVPIEDVSILEELSDIKTMLPFLGLSMSEFITKLAAAMNDGSVMYANGRFYSESSEEVDLSRFKEACDEKGMDYQKTIDKMTQIVWQS